MFGRKRMRALELQTAVLIGALAWYANEHHWRRKHVSPKGQPRQWEKSQATADRGERAREVIQRFEDEQLPATWVDRLVDWLCGPEDQPVPWRARAAHPKRRSSDAAGRGAEKPFYRATVPNPLAGGEPIAPSTVPQSLVTADTE